MRCWGGSWLCNGVGTGRASPSAQPLQTPHPPGVLGTQPHSRKLRAINSPLNPAQGPGDGDGGARARPQPPTSSLTRGADVQPPAAQPRVRLRHPRSRGRGHLGTQDRDGATGRPRSARGGSESQHAHACSRRGAPRSRQALPQPLTHPPKARLRARRLHPAIPGAPRAPRTPTPALPPTAAASSARAHSPSTRAPPRPPAALPRTGAAPPQPPPPRRPHAAPLRPATLGSPGTPRRRWEAPQWEPVGAGRRRGRRAGGKGRRRERKFRPLGPGPARPRGPHPRNRVSRAPPPPSHAPSARSSRGPGAGGRGVAPSQSRERGGRPPTCLAGARNFPEVRGGASARPGNPAPSPRPPTPRAREAKAPGSWSVRLPPAAATAGGATPGTDPCAPRRPRAARSATTPAPGPRPPSSGGIHSSGRGGRAGPGAAAGHPARGSRRAEPP